MSGHLEPFLDKIPVFDYVGFWYILAYFYLISHLNSVAII